MESDEPFLGWLGLCVMLPKYIGSKYGGGGTDPSFFWVFSTLIAWLTEHVRFTSGLSEGIFSMMSCMDIHIWATVLACVGAGGFHWQGWNPFLGGLLGYGGMMCLLLQLKDEEDHPDSSTPRLRENPVDDPLYKERFSQALALLCGQSPPDYLVDNWLLGEYDPEYDPDAYDLQDWAAQHAPFPWAMGITTIDAAEALAREPRGEP